DIGCVRLTERALAGDPPSESSVAEASALVTELLAPAFEAVPVAKAATWIGVAGTVTTLSALAMRLPTYDAARIHNSVLSAGQISAISAELLAMPRAERAQLGAMHPGRVDVIGGGALVVRVLAEQLAERAGITELRVSEHDILDGIALSLGRGGHADTAGHER
ncbi:MAG: exopolyphosphatase, partial [Sciscionella sp.]